MSVDRHIGNVKGWKVGVDTFCDRCHALSMESMFRHTESVVESHLNSWSRPDAEQRLRHCLDVTRWVEAMLASRPYVDDKAVREAIEKSAHPFHENEIHHALTHHPRIGDRPTGDDAHSRDARTEQSGVDVSERDIREQLRRGNEAYEARFGHVFLIRAAGRSASDVLSELSRRMNNDPADELTVVEHELRDIAAVRLLGPVRRG